MIVLIGRMSAKPESNLPAFLVSEKTKEYAYSWRGFKPIKQSCMVLDFCSAFLALTEPQRQNERQMRSGCQMNETRWAVETGEQSVMEKPNGDNSP